MKYCLAALMILVTGLFCHAQTHEIDSVKNLIATTSSDSLKAAALADLCWLSKYSEPENALRYGRQAVAICDDNNFEELKAHALNTIGVTYWSIGNYDSAAIYIEWVNELYGKLNNERGQAVAMTNLGLVFQNQGNYEKSLEYSLAALRVMEKMKDTSLIASVYSNIGNVYFLREEYPTAKDYYFRSLALKRSTKLNVMRQNVHKTLNNIANTYIKMDEPDSALMYFRSSVAYAEKVADYKNMCLAFSEMGIAFNRKKLYDSALYFYKKGLDIYEGGKFSNDYDKTVLLSSISQTYLDKNQIKPAVEYAERSLALAKEINNINKLKDSYALTSMVYEKAGRLGDALAAHKLYLSYRDSVMNEEKNKQIKELETKYETDKKNQEIEFLNAENSLKAATIQRNYVFMGGLVLVIALLVIVFYLLRYRERFRQQAVLQEQKVRMRDLQMRAVIDSQEKERRRFAADLHDGMGQLVSALQLNIQSLKNHRENPDQRDHLFSHSESILKDIHTEIRNIAFNLMPPVLSKEGLVPAIQELARRINQTSSLQVEVSAHDTPDRFRDVMEVSLYRVIQEILSNIIKYAKASRVTIAFTGYPDEVILTIEDNGEGFSLEAFQNSEGNGWRNIHSRLNLIRASIDIDTVPGRKNNTVIITIPLAVPATEEPAMA